MSAPEGTAGTTVTTAPDRLAGVRLIRGPSDRRLVGRLLPFIVVLSVLGPILAASLRSIGASNVLAVVGATFGTSLVLAGLLGVVLQAQRELTTQIESRDSQLLTILDGLPIAVMLRASDGALLHVNPGGERFIERLGVSIADVHRGPSSLIEHVRVIDEDGRLYAAEDLPVVVAMRDGVSREATVGYPLPGGGHVWYSIRAVPVPLNDGSTGIVVTCDDVTARHEDRQRVEVAERTLRRTFDHAPIGIALLAPDGSLLQVNAALCDLLGYDEERLLAEGLQIAARPDDGDEDWKPLTVRMSGVEEGYLIDRHFRHSSGRVLFTQMSVVVVRAEDGTTLHLIVQVVDLSERRDLEQELRAAALKDPLTGLANRRALAVHLTEAQKRRARGGGEIGLLYLDLDRFKAVNDTHGHDVGDRVLVETGQRLLAATRDVDSVCRMGGDEFVILCAPIAGARGLQDLVDRLTAMPPLTVLVAGEPVAVVGSIGSIMVAPNEDLDSALRRADAAMYRAKRGEPVSVRDIRLRS